MGFVCHDDNISSGRQSLFTFLKFLYRSKNNAVGDSAVKPVPQTDHRIFAGFVFLNILL